ncbi:hypothetical protein Tco_1099318 [Tanacetum coccineum]
MSAAVARGYGGDDGRDDPSRPPPLWDAEKPPGETGETTEMEEGRQNFDLAPHMRSRLWIDIDKGIEQHFAKVYTDNKSYIKCTYWSVKHGETRDGIRKLTFGLTLSTLPEPLKMFKTGLRAWSFADKDHAHWLSFEINTQDTL